MPPPPEIVIISPINGDRLVLEQETLVEVDVNDPAQAVTNIELLVDGVKAVDSPDSYISWIPYFIGIHQLTAVAADWNGNWVTSAPVNVAVVVMYPPTVTVTSPPTEFISLPRLCRPWSRQQAIRMASSPTSLSNWTAWCWEQPTAQPWNCLPPIFLAAGTLSWPGQLTTTVSRPPLPPSALH